MRLRIKAIPNARQSGIVGLIGDRLKIKVNAPAEDGKANQAICGLLARKLGLKPRDLTLEHGHTDPEKTFRAEGIGPDQALAMLGLAGPAEGDQAGLGTTPP